MPVYPSDLAGRITQLEREQDDAEQRLSQMEAEIKRLVHKLWTNHVSNVLAQPDSVPSNPPTLEME